MAGPTARPRSKPEEVLHEYPQVGRYRVRVVAKAKSDAAMVTALDVREYVSAEKFEGFTRRGIRLTTFNEVQSLRDALNDILERERLNPPAKPEPAKSETTKS